MVNQAQISLIFPTYNRPEEVIFNLNYFRENITVPYEVFVLDNSARELKYEFRDNEIYHFFGENRGTAARNVGIQQASSPICLMLDDDSHPEKGMAEVIIETFTNLAENIAGIICDINNPDGGKEASLLPTVFHGAGVAFKTETLRNCNLFYPDYCFYGEEYRLTAEIYRAGYELQNCRDIKIIHRRSQVGRDLAKIFYFLGKNNSSIWEDIVPDEFLEQVLYDSNRRYELTSSKENVNDHFLRGQKDRSTTLSPNPMSKATFEAYSLLNKFKTLELPEEVILAGTGKFPSLWAKFLHGLGHKVKISDLNPGLIGKSFKEFKIISPEEAMNSNSTFITGHSSNIDNEKWISYLETNQKSYIDISESNKLNLI